MIDQNNIVDHAKTNPVVRSARAGSVSLHIERLVLDGLDISTGEAGVVQVAVEAELARLIGSDGVDQALDQALVGGGAIPFLRGDALQMRTDAGPSQLGSQIARAVYGGLRAPERGTNRR